MNTNTKQFLKLIEKVTAAGKETNLNRIARDFVSEGFSLESPIIIEYSKKHFKPLDFESYFTKENNINKLYFITAVKEKENINFYSFVYIYKGIKEAKFLDFVYYCYKSNAELRKNALYTILIYQNKKYIESMQQKKEKRAENNKINIKDRFLFVKDFYNNYGDDESIKQRYKYYQKDFYNNILFKNMLLSMKYNFNVSNGTAYRDGVKNFEIDKSGYILTYRRDDLKRRAAALKEERARDNFEKFHHEYYLKALKADKNSIEAQLLTAYRKAAQDGLKAIQLLNGLYEARVSGLLKQLKDYISKLEKKDFSRGWFNSSIISFEKNIIELHQDYYNFINSEAAAYNKFINFDILLKDIEAQLGYYDYTKLLENNGVKNTLSKYIFNDYKEKIKIENGYKIGYIYFLGYKKKIENYFKFLEN